MTLVTSDAGRGLAWALAGRLFTVIVVLPLMSVLFNCSRAPPDPSSKDLFASRAMTQRQGPVTVSAAVLSADEGQRYFGAGLADQGIQAIWLSVENSGDATGARMPIRSTRLPGSVSGPRRVDRRFPWARPFPPRSPPRTNPLCSTASPVLRPRPNPHPRACSSSAFAFMSRSGLPSRIRMRPPRFRAKDVSTCMGSPTGEAPHRQAIPARGCCLLVFELDRHLGIRPVSQLDTQPMVSPVNASS